MDAPMKQGEIRQCDGGWKICVHEPSQSISGPWLTEEAAKAAARGEYERAWELEKISSNLSAKQAYRG